jgi:hypothetical protein
MSVTTNEANRAGESAISSDEAESDDETATSDRRTNAPMAPRTVR